MALSPLASINSPLIQSRPPLSRVMIGRALQRAGLLAEEAAETPVSAKPDRCRAPVQWVAARRPIPLQPRDHTKDEHQLPTEAIHSTNRGV